MLKTHELVKYLPYDVLVQYEYYLPSDLALKCGDKKYTRLTFDNIRNIIKEKNIKPYLRPISQMAEEITHNGEKIVPLVELAKLAGFDESDLYLYQWFLNGSKMLIDIGETGRKSFGYLHGSFVETNGMVITPVDDQPKFFEWCYEHKIWLGDQKYFDKGLILKLEN